MALMAADTALEILLRQKVGMLELQRSNTLLSAVIGRVSHRVCDRITFSIRRAPYAADTWQMLDDLGIEPAPRRRPLPRDVTIQVTNRTIVYSHTFDEALSLSQCEPESGVRE